MNTTKKLFALMLIGVLLVVSFVPSTFSWYPHNDTEEGKSIHYADDLELSLKTASDSVSMSTVTCDKNGLVSNTNTVTGISANAGTVVYYKTTIENSGSDPVMVDLETLNLPNNADFAIGTFSPTINEKAFASRAVRSKVSDDKVRVYFKTNSSMASYWAVDNGRLLREAGTYMPDGSTPTSTAAAGSSSQTSSSTGTTNDINISYTVDGKEVQMMMTRTNSSNYDTITDDSGTNKVYYADIPSGTEKFYFFNHWYLRSASNREWNRTIDITDLSAGKLYYLTGQSVDNQWKEYKSRDVDHTLVAVNNYYKSVRMSLGNSIFADISLKKDSDTEDEEFVPDYYGNSISYSVYSGSSYVSVNKDGLITPKAAGTATVRTTITGRYGDTRILDTTVYIPTNIDQVPIIKNVRVPEGDSVDVYWYARNNSSTERMSTGAIFLTI